MATITFETLDTDTCPIEVELPAKFEVCSRCDGNGKHVSPAIDGNGISREQFEEDPDFEQAYFSGRYDVAWQWAKDAGYQEYNVFRQRKVERVEKL